MSSCFDSEGVYYHDYWITQALAPCIEVSSQWRSILVVCEPPLSNDLIYIYFVPMLDWKFEGKHVHRIYNKEVSNLNLAHISIHVVMVWKLKLINY